MRMYTLVNSLLSADQALREAVTGISPPEAEKHQLYVDVQPIMGTTMKARARVQINLAVSQVRDIKQVASFPDIVFPIMWFEDVSIAPITVITPNYPIRARLSLLKETSVDVLR